MSVLERLKAFFTRPKSEVIENISDNGLNQSKPMKTDDLQYKQTYSNTEETDNYSSKKMNDSQNLNVIDSEKDSKNENSVKEEKAEEKVEVKTNSKEANNKKEEKDSMTLLKDNEKLTLDNVDEDFTKLFIDAGIESLAVCFQCGTCTGGCPSGRRTPYRVRQLVRNCLMGLKDQVISDDALWMCTTCYTCQERCPREIKIVEIVKKARNEAAKAGFMAPAHKATGSFVIKTGHGVPINDATKELRNRVGLGELPPTTHKFPEALKEVQTITEITGFDDLIGFNKKTGELE
ncbi:succinate dehydrogenase/fumarate reductase iron-sulfur subunit [Methanobrevibacter cuticularis]|uniref:Succinate dehydrogenase/fumarate reductase iron-sulfur subunit n=1 Tax=Methanobrevibacter cuticularis TaxID=47311 RepID=A0A166EMU0_9EURY|nr:CoB--CoM heterodisulfide reductase subunit C [Methanobrevibacter cuticularis]KZX16823.1 succinate dehydrogenase/fumarate reductase iron-sulfur subunit [Methanobrevibacter cuticularis]